MPKSEPTAPQPPHPPDVRREAEHGADGEELDGEGEGGTIEMGTTAGMALGYQRSFLEEDDPPGRRAVQQQGALVCTATQSTHCKK